MSAIKEYLLRQVEEVRTLLSTFPNCQVVGEDHTQITIRCPNTKVSRPLAFSINDAGYAVEIRRGITSSRIYVRAILNQPC